MRRREFIALMGASVAWPFAAMAQQAGRMYRIGLLWGGARTSEVEPVVTAFLDEVGRHGFIEGMNLTVDYRAFALHPDRLSEYAAELVKGRVDVIGATGNMAIRAAQEATKTIPILGITDDLLGSGLVNSMARPNGNTTGVSILAGDLDGKRQDILIEALPGLRRMAALADSNMSTEAKLDVLEEAARARNIELSIHRIATGEEIAATLDRAKASGATALNVLASPLLWTNRRLIMDRAAALRLPAIYEWAEMAEEGGFAAYGPSLIGVFRDPHAGQLVQLLRGIKVADIPVQQPTKFELVINLKTAKAMGVTVPEALLVRADKVIE
jgi:putative tryptophan/tyrosine transport system substrate-binding protein